LINPQYYRNPKGVVGLSLDEGETLMLPSGKVLPVRHEVWEADSDDPEAELSPKQQAYLAAHRSKPPMTEIDELAWKLHKGMRSLHRTFDIPNTDVPRREEGEVTLAEVSDTKD